MFYLLIIVGTICGYLLSILPEFVGAMILLGAILGALVGIYIQLILIEKKFKSTLNINSIEYKTRKIG